MEAKATIFTIQHNIIKASTLLGPTQFFSSEKRIIKTNLNKPPTSFFLYFMLYTIPNSKCLV